MSTINFIKISAIRNWFFAFVQLRIAPASSSGHSISRKDPLSAALGRKPTASSIGWPCRRCWREQANLEIRADAVADIIMDTRSTCVGVVPIGHKLRLAA
jgi:hypothetical protein